MGVKVRERDGAWWLFIDHKGQRKAKRVGVGKEGHRAAKTAEEKIQARLALGGAASYFEEERKVPTFQAAADQWLETHAQLGQIRSSTRAEYARPLRLYAYPRIGSKPVTAVTREDVRG